MAFKCSFLGGELRAQAMEKLFLNEDCYKLVFAFADINCKKGLSRFATVVKSLDELSPWFHHRWDPELRADMENIVRPYYWVSWENYAL